MGHFNLLDSLWKLQWVICLWAGPFVLQIATWDLGLWLLSRTFTLSQLSISERWNFQPPGKDAAHMTILYISLLSCACPCYKVKVAGVLAGQVERESLSSAFSPMWTRKLWPCSSSWTNTISVTYLKGRITQVHCRIRLDPAALKWGKEDLPCCHYVMGKNLILPSRRSRAKKGMRKIGSGITWAHKSSSK